jgi:hypothetical protein
MGFALDGVYPTWGLPYMGFALGYMVFTYMGFTLHGVYPTWGLPYMGFTHTGFTLHGVCPTWGPTGALLLGLLLLDLQVP